MKGKTKVTDDAGFTSNVYCHTQGQTHNTL